MKRNECSLVKCYYWVGALNSPAPDAIDLIVLRSSISLHDQDVRACFAKKNVALRNVDSKTDPRLAFTTMIFKDKRDNDRYIAPESLLKSHLCRAILSKYDGRDFGCLFRDKCSIQSGP